MLTNTMKLIQSLAPEAHMAGDDVIYRYLSRESVSIRGNLHSVDAVCIAALMQYQGVSQIAGSAAEIGVFFGRCSILLGKLLMPGEGLFVVDIFDEHQAGSDRPQLRKFKENAARLDVLVREDCTWVGPSETLKAEDVTQRVGPIRMFSVDGGHMLEHLNHDSELAVQCLADEGIIAFDDVFNPEWPETTTGVLSFLDRHEGKMVAFAQTRDKLFVSRPEMALRYIAALKASQWTRGYLMRETRFNGNKSLWIHHEIKDRVIYHLLTMAGMPALAFRQQSARRY